MILLTPNTKYISFNLHLTRWYLLRPLLDRHGLHVCTPVSPDTRFLKHYMVSSPQRITCYSSPDVLTRCCKLCRCAKVQIHISTSIMPFAPTKRYIGHILVNLIRPLPPSNWFMYLLTVVDRFTRRPEAWSLDNTLVYAAPSSSFPRLTG